MDPEELKKKQAREERELKTKWLLKNTADFNHVDLLTLAANRSVYYDRDKNDKFRRVRFWGRFAFFEEEFGKVRAEGGLSLAKEKYIRLFTQFQDCGGLFVDRKAHNGRLAKKLNLFKSGDRLQVFGRVFITEDGFIILVDDLVAW
jgi:hypothetical protein